ncbi:dihydroorotate dehydrogenase [Anaerotalea alkaliphila]|uniref:Dihydroorotate dehydrogenase n=1 Tax=Anaerotalea alkaliphila TaxID=2662126 RepID=A0A7X5HWY7_9FIRM|nr:dihydroorotate dehydrogenase [Anaerotalea alkaliphila]NDL68188.1 dihydroorotate dehydrogenase [Anaerotalea alkaliphila]
MRMEVEIAGVRLKNPVTTASGTFGSGREYEPYVDINRLGAVIVKGVANKEWLGNPAPRIAETYGGMLNSVGLQNPGVDAFMLEDIPFLRRFDTKIVVNIAGRTVEEYCEVVEKLRDADVDMLELNISCPNVKEGGVAFGIDPKMAELATREVKKVARQPLVVKLSPNVTDIVEIAKAVESGGADAVSLINTLIGMRIDARKRKPVLANKIGGLSGPAVKPVALRMVYQVAKAVDLPVIGLGGIMTGEDAIEFMMAGATAVSVGTANLLDPGATMRILDEMEAFLQENNIRDIRDIIGVVE